MEANVRVAVHIDLLRTTALLHVGGPMPLLPVPSASLQGPQHALDAHAAFQPHKPCY
jgi:hypothetical protein